MRFNEILAGAVTDVVVSVYGDDLAQIDRLAHAVAKSCSSEPGAEDVRLLGRDSFFAYVVTASVAVNGVILARFHRTACEFGCGG